MARKRRRKKSSDSGIFVLFILGVIAYVIEAVFDFVVKNSALIITIGVIVVIVTITITIVKKSIEYKKQKEWLEEQRKNEQRQRERLEEQRINEQRQRERLKEQSIIIKQRRELLYEILCELHLENSSLFLNEYDDLIYVKSVQALNNYSNYKYLKEIGSFEKIRAKIEEQSGITESLYSFLRDNNYKTKTQYDYVEKQLCDYADIANSYRVKVVYITTAGNNRGERILNITETQITEAVEHPELLMTKAEYNRFLKQQAKEKLDAKKCSYYKRVNDIIGFVNSTKEVMVVKSSIITLDELVQDLIDNTVNSIKKAKSIDSDEWRLLDSIITMKDDQIKRIVQKDKQICHYYASEDFALIKETCHLLTESQKEFNEYIEEKAESITKLFGKRAVRNETQNEYTYNYTRPYKKSLSPLTAELSAAAFGSAERNQMDYVVKCFYPDKSRYKEQIQNLRVLIEELETLSEAKTIIDNYKKEYEEYIQNVPEYVMENDEEGFYSRLGLTIIDEAVLNVEYRFNYTSDGGLAQRHFTVPMNEENITELINRLASKLSLEAFAQEQRSLMTSKLRAYIKERDNYTCCMCSNSVFAEPNLLLEIDHIIPISKGGLTQEDNLQTLCWKCNRSKGAKMESGVC